MKPHLLLRAEPARSKPARVRRHRVFVGLWIPALAALALISGVPALSAELHGHVFTAQGPLADSAVTLWAAGADEPRQLGHTQSSADGSFVLNAAAKGGVLYVIAQGGHPVGRTGGPNGLSLLALLGEDVPDTVVVNELTTVASAFAAAQFIHGGVDLWQPAGPAHRCR